MRRTFLRKKTFWLLSLLLGSAICISVIFWGTLSVASMRQWPPSKRLLPGEQIWKQGVPSFLFGTNDTYEWSSSTIETRPEIQNALHAAGIPLIRTFFKNGADDASIEQRIQTIENIQAHCLGVITNIFDIPYTTHLVRYLGNRCVIYEFGNEPDYNHISVDSYLKQWNQVIPLLRRINPAAVFVGPVLSEVDQSYLEAFLRGVAASKILPDAISFHWYPCYQDEQAACLSKVETLGQQVQRVRGLVNTILHQNLPLGISEWNFDPGNPPPAYGDRADFITQFTTQALDAMKQVGVNFACQFDAASFAGYGHLDMFDQQGLPKPQFVALKTFIATYRPS